MPRRKKSPAHDLTDLIAMLPWWAGVVLGVVTETDGGGADGGIDLILSKGGEKFLVQCKQWRAFRVALLHGRRPSPGEEIDARELGAQPLTGSVVVA